MTIRIILISLAFLVAHAVPGLAQTLADGAPVLSKPTSAEAALLAREFPAAGPTPREILQSGPGSRRERPADIEPGVIRSRIVSIDAAGLRALIDAPDLMVDAAGLPAGNVPSFPLALFDDVNIRLVKLDAYQNDLGSLSLRAVLAGDRPGTVTLVIDGSRVTGSVKMVGRHFNIMPVADGMHRVSELEIVAFHPGRDDGVRPFGLSDTAERAVAAQAIEDPLHGARVRERQSANSVITLMFAYTAGASSSISNIKSAIALAVTDANTVFANSQVPAELRLVGVERVTYDDANTSADGILTALSNGTGDFARIQQIRSALRADLVAVVSRVSDGNLCGLGYVNDELDTRLASNAWVFGASMMVADTSGGCFSNNTLAHEIGHNLGAEHDRFIVQDDPPGPTKFAYGYVDLIGRFRDVMSYDDHCRDQNIECLDLAFFSNPNLSHQGRPIGVPFDQPTAADASRKISASIANAIRFRTQLPAPPNPILSVLVEGNGSVTSNPAGISCGDSCNAAFQGSPQITLAAAPSPRSAMRAWSGDCSGSGPCTVTVSANRSVTATFEAAERSGPIFSSAQSDSQSFVRFYNTGSTAGTVTVTLNNAATGQTLGQWTSPTIPAGAAPQFPVTTLESALPPGTVKPAYYAAIIRPQISGFFQHVLFRPADGTLTNLSTCEVSSSANALALANVHSTLLDNGYPSSIAITNSGASAINPVRLEILDARDGIKLGTYVSPSLGPNAQAVVTVAQMQAAAGITPPAGAFHYVVKSETPFTGFLQHLVNNQRVGVITDMTTTCSFGTLPTAVATEAIRNPGPFFSTAQTESQSFLRLLNTGTTPGTARVTLTRSETAAVLGRWVSPTIAPGAAPQFPISEIETMLTPGINKPQYYSALVEAQFDGLLQHVLFRPADGTLTNLSSCNASVGANATRLTNVHTSILDNGYPSSVAIANTGSTAAAATLAIFNAATGARLGTYTSPSIPSGGQVVITVSSIETQAGLTPGSGQFHYVVSIEGSFRGFLQHLVNNQRAGVITDMTTSCELGARSVTYSDCDSFDAACPIQTDGTEVQGQLKKNGAFQYFRATLSGDRTYTIEAKGVDSNNGTLARPSVSVFPQTGPQVGGGSLGGVGRDARISFTATANSSYFIVIGGFTLTSNGLVTAHPSGSYKVSIR